MPIDLPIERLFEGRPIIIPRGEGWESGVTFNSAAVLLEPTPENLPAIQALLGPDHSPRAIVALHYRARPDVDPGFRHTRSYVGLSVHEPDLTLIRRFEEPVVSPEIGGGADVLGAEDPRITWLDNRWWMTYCGVSPFVDPDPDKAWLGSVCVASSENLVDWEKSGSVEGLSGDGARPYSNKDGVLFPDRIDGKVMMLHRPMDGPMTNWSTSIASADEPAGPYTDHGKVYEPDRRPEYNLSWSGAGAAPIKLSDGVYLSIEHTGNFLPGKKRKYVLDAFLYDFNRWNPNDPKSLVAARLNDFMRPETDFEINGPFPESVANVVFTCGAYVHEGWVYMVYGGGDSFILAARVRLNDLVGALTAQVRELAGVA